MSMAETGSLKSYRCPNPYGKVRIIGKIRGFRDQESVSLNQDSKPWITVQKPHENDFSKKCSLFFESQSNSRKDAYELDYCYEPDEEIGLIYSREIKPLVSEVFNGRNAAVVALGARGSGKTYVIQGSQETPGLAVMALSDILSKAKELEKSIFISFYELTQDHAYDLLDPKHPEIQVLEDAHGKVNFKGLSRVSVESISDFRSIYFSKGDVQKSQKAPASHHQCNHKGLMVCISSGNDKLKAKIENKIHFVDLAGYEDPRKGSKDGVALAESNRTNKSLYALLNVVSALKAKDTRVPYRESKLTRILQDSLDCMSHVLLITCLNPYFCQDSISSINLVSRSNRSTKQVLTDSTNRSQSSAKVKVPSSSIKSGKLMSGSRSVKKEVGYSRQFSEKKPTSILKGRKLFAEGKRSNTKQLRCYSEDTSAHKSKILPDLSLTPFSLEEGPQDKSVSEVSPKKDLKEDINVEGSEPESISQLKEAINLDKNDFSSQYEIKQMEATPNINLDEKAITHFEEYNASAFTCAQNTTSYKKDDSSPPLSERIREISNNLKALYSSTPLRITMPSEEVGAPSIGPISIVEPQTPVMGIGKNSGCYSPCGNFGNRSSGVKQSIVREYLKILNSATKEELKSLKGIGEKRATYILELREESPEPFKSLDDLQDIGLSAKQIKGMMKKVAGNLFD